MFIYFINKNKLIKIKNLLNRGIIIRDKTNFPKMIFCLNNFAVTNLNFFVFFNYFFLTLYIFIYNFKIINFIIIDIL